MVGNRPRGAHTHSERGDRGLKTKPMCREPFGPLHFYILIIRLGLPQHVHNIGVPHHSPHALYLLECP